VLTLLAITIANNAFKDYTTMEEPLNIEPPDDDEMHPLQFKKKVFDTPFFHMSTGEIQKANIFSNRLRELGYRAGYVRPP
jgi:hypothetical protein